eukprot:TRINITY_DN214_c0_g1_i5.p2 TRINITY_DN214_c0_g1~~TRINITY_DN214_c0_g1_i5.p2  ORF type:complete len:137 (-),score=19.99 TRINITY_DN214_c0_g1_i5:410-772(-)
MTRTRRRKKTYKEEVIERIEKAITAIDYHENDIHQVVIFALHEFQVYPQISVQEMETLLKENGISNSSHVQQSGIIKDFVNNSQTCVDYPGPMSDLLDKFSQQNYRQAVLDLYDDVRRFR